MIVCESAAFETAATSWEDLKLDFQKPKFSDADHVEILMRESENLRRFFIAGFTDSRTMWEIPIKRRNGESILDAAKRTLQKFNEVYNTKYAFNFQS